MIEISYGTSISLDNGEEINLIKVGDTEFDYRTWHDGEWVSKMTCYCNTQERRDRVFEALSNDYDYLEMIYHLAYFIGSLL